VVAGAGGVFQIPNVDLTRGDNSFLLTATNQVGKSTTANLTVNRSGTVGTDVSLTWNQQTLDTIKAFALYPEDATRLMAMVSLAQYDTLAAIEGTPAYLVHHDVTTAVSTQAALANAAWSVLSSLFPTRQAVLDAALASSLTGIADGPLKADGLALGATIGQQIVAIRASDGSGNFADYPGSNAVGQWRPTGPMYLVAEQPQWRDVTPFALESPDEFRLLPPPPLDSADYATALNEIQSLGEATSTTRTADQTTQALFWADGRGSYTPPGHWNAIAQAVAQQEGTSLSANVRMFAMLNVAMAVSAIAAWDTKFTYNLWRPIDAVPGADLDGNDATTADPDWQPLLITPPHPEYVSGHSTFSNAAQTILASIFGDHTPFSTTAVTLPGVTRSFTSFTDAAAEAGRSRIYGGIHYEFSNQGGRQLGQLVAQATLDRFALSQDTQAPAVVAQSTPAVDKNNITLSGQLLDNLSGVASATFVIDGGAAQALNFDSQGNFSIATTFPLDGTGNGDHTIAITATDAAGNVAAGFSRTFTLDSTAPTLTLPSLANGDTVSTSSRLTGVANPTGSKLVALG
jgi:hypothetical protein